MAMLTKNVTVSFSLTTTHERNGVETGKTIHSEPGIRAQLMLVPNHEYRLRDKPTQARLSVEIDIDNPPNLAPDELNDWIRDTLIEMLGDAKVGD